MTTGLLSHLAAKTAADTRLMALLAPTVAGMGFDLVRVRLMGGRGPASPLTLQIMAEKPDGSMEVDDCAKLSEAVSALLDVEDPIERDYSLEVSSPGIDRPLTRLKDFSEHEGHEARLELGMGLDGRKRFRGKLLGLTPDGAAIRVLAEGAGDVALPLADLTEARLVLTDALIAESLKRRRVSNPDAADEIETDMGEDEAPANDDAPPSAAAPKKPAKPAKPRRPSRRGDSENDNDKADGRAD